MKGAVLLLPLLGLTWTFGLLAVNSETIVFQYLFTIFNSLQGCFVFIFHCIMNSEVRQAWNRKREQIMLSRGEFDANTLMAFGMNTTNSPHQCKSSSGDYMVDTEDIRTSNLTSIPETDLGATNSVEKIKINGQDNLRRSTRPRPRKRQPCPVSRCETPIEESIPGAILDNTDTMEEVRVTHRIIENDDWTVQERRHVTRKMTLKKHATDQSDHDDVAMNGATPPGDYPDFAPPPYVKGNFPRKSPTGSHEKGCFRDHPSQTGGCPLPGKVPVSNPLHEDIYGEFCSLPKKEKSGAVGKHPAITARGALPSLRTSNRNGESPLPDGSADNHESFAPVGATSGIYSISSMLDD